MSIDGVIVLLTALLTTAVTLISLTIIYTRRRQETYDQNLNKYKLESLRDALEAEIYKINSRLTATEDRWRDVNHLVLSSQAAQNVNAGLGPPVLTSFLRNCGLTEKDIEIDESLIFVLTPFHTACEEDFRGIVLLCRELGLTAKRGDEQYIAGDIFSHVLKLLVKSRIVIANLNGRNPNVFYELGIAHALDKQTILISSAPNELIFDVKSKKVVIYSTAEELQQRLRSELARALVGLRTHSAPKERL
jgi:hypothetical protein